MRFPTSDDDIRALRLKVLRALSAAASPKLAIGAVAANNGFTVDDVKALVVNYGWPDPHEMRVQLAHLEGRTPPAAAVHQEPTGSATPVNFIDRLLTAGDQSKRARTRSLAAKIRESLNDLRELVITERKEIEEAEAKAAERARLQAEVEALQKQLAEKKALLKGVPANTTSRGTVTKPASSAKTIRAWAEQNGIDCPAHGRVPRAVVEAYDAAMGIGA